MHDIFVYKYHEICFGIRDMCVYVYVRQSVIHIHRLNLANETNPFWSFINNTKNRFLEFEKLHNKNLIWKGNPYLIHFNLDDGNPW